MQQPACYSVLMPNINMDAKAFETTRAGWFGNAVSWRRNALALTASELARRTAALGYPISRGAIAKIESNLRSGKIDVAEVLVLAAALEIPPVLLLFPQLATDGGAAVLPGFLAKEDDAVRWISGQVSFPQQYSLASARVEGQPNPPNDGTNLIAAMSSLDRLLDNRISLVNYWYSVREDTAEAETAQRMLEKNNEQIAAVEQQIRDARDGLWGRRPKLDQPEDESDD
jgi:transcriptional regulator with XRE-family HTH domain